MFVSTIVIDLSPICSSIFSAKHMTSTYTTIFRESFRNSHTNIFRGTRYPIKIKLPCTMVLHLPCLPCVFSFSDNCSVVIIIADLFQRSETLIFIFLSLLIESVAMRDIDVIVWIFTSYILLWPGASTDVENILTWECSVSRRGICAEVLRPPCTFEV